MTALRISLVALCAFLAGCAPPLKDPWGLAVSRGRTPGPASAPAPSKIQADLGVTPHVPGAMTLSSRIYIDRTATSPRYRLDIFGLFTPVAAAWLWQNDAWLLVRHDTRQALSGTGSSFVLTPDGGSPLIIPDLHAVLGFLWGDVLPGFTGFAGGPPGPGRVENLVIGDSGRVSWTQGGTPWTARFDPATGLCLEASSPQVTLRYARHARAPWGGGRVVPGEVQVFARGDKVLTLTVRDRAVSPVWRKDPFVLTVPEGYDSTTLGR